MVKAQSLSSNGHNTDNKSSDLIAALYYLIDKAELCAQDKQAFYLSNVIAPKLHSSEGKSIERKALHERFGEITPITSRWVESLVENNHDEMLRRDSKTRRNLIKQGWVNTILFQRKNHAAMPEIFWLDVHNMQSIRKTSRTAAAGCALGLHACHAAKCNPELLMTKESEGRELVQALGNHRHETVAAYEQSIEDAVVALAQHWKGSLDLPIDLESLRGKTRSLLRGQDAVVQLLNDRILGVFSALAVMEPPDIPPARMQSGRHPASIQTKVASPLNLLAREKFRTKGLAFYASDLARAAELACKVGALAYDLYAEDFLDRMILQALN